MHNYVHEYRQSFVKEKGKMPRRRLDYTGSRCGVETCPDSRHPVTLPVVKAHNDDNPGVTFSPNSRVLSGTR